MNRILVVGEHSYIGTSFCKYIKKMAAETEVTAVSARDEKWKEIDFAAFDIVLHVAAIVHKKEQEDMHPLYQEVNTNLPLKLAERAKRGGVKRFVFMSTMAVYGGNIPMIDSATPLCPVTMYGKSKLEAEEKLKELTDDEFSVIVFRPPMVYGADCPGNYERLSKLARKVSFFPKVNNRRSMIYIENLCACIYHEIEKNEQGYRVVCPQNAEYVNTTELVKEIRRAYGKRTFVIPFPQAVIRCLTKRSTMLEKVFGDCCYEYEKECEEYQTVGFKESIRRSENR